MTVLLDANDRLVDYVACTVDPFSSPDMFRTVSGHAVASLNYDRHLYHCKRNTFRCPHCQLAMPKAEQSKHVEMQHAPVSSAPLRQTVP